MNLALAAPGAIALGLFFLLPLGAIALEAGPAAYGRLLSDPLFWAGLRGSLALSLGAAALATLVGAGVALHLSRLPERARGAVMVAIALPLTFSGLVVAYGFILGFGRAGFITLLLAQAGVDPAWFAGFIYGPVGLAFAYAYYLTPRVILVLLPVLVNFDRQQLQAAESLGASRWGAIRWILLPQVAPAVAAAAALVSAVAFGAYGTALALVGTQLNILPLLLYAKIGESGTDFPAAAALSVVLLGMCTGLMALGELAAARKEAVAHVPA